MVITIIDKNYKCGSNIGLTFLEKPSLVAKLNSIIEWEFCKFPEVKDDKGNSSENKTFLGDDPELTPGVRFVYDDQVLAIDNMERIILLESPTGINALNRIWNDSIKLEFELFFNGSNPTVTWKFIENDQEQVKSKYDEEYHVPYNLYKIFKDRFINGRFDVNNICIEATVDSDYFAYPLNICLTTWGIKYKSSELECEDELLLMSKEVISYFCNTYKRQKVDESYLEKLNNSIESLLV